MKDHIYIKIESDPLGLITFPIILSLLSSPWLFVFDWSIFQKRNGDKKRISPLSPIEKEQKKTRKVLAAQKLYNPRNSIA